MDFGDLIILLILLAPLLRRLFGKRQAPPRPQNGTTEGQPARLSSPEHDPLAEALRQIRVALAEPESEPTAMSTPPKPLPPRPKPIIRDPKPAPAFHALGAFEHDEHGFGKSNPLSEEVFERHPIRPATKKQIKQQALDKIDLKTPIEVTKADAARGTDYTRMLTDAARLQEAFVMKEILDPPRSMHRGR